MDVSLTLKSTLKSRGISVPDTSVYDSCVNLAHEYSLSAEDVADELEAVNDGKDINPAMLIVIRNSLVRACAYGEERKGIVRVRILRL